MSSGERWKEEACGSAGGRQEGRGKRPAERRAGRGHRDHQFLSWFPLCSPWGAGKVTEPFCLSHVLLGKQNQVPPCFMTLPSSRKAAGEFSSSEAEPSCISCSGSLEAGLVYLCYLLAVGLRWTLNPWGSLVLSCQVRTVSNVTCLPQRVGGRIQSYQEWERISRMHYCELRENFQVRNDNIGPLAVVAITCLHWLASDPPTICKLGGVRVEGSWWPQNRAHIKSQDNQTYKFSLLAEESEDHMIYRQPPSSRVLACEARPGWSLWTCSLTHGIVTPIPK